MDRNFAVLLGISFSVHVAAFCLVGDETTPPLADTEQGRMSVAVRYIAPATPPQPRAEFKPVDPVVEPEPMAVVEPNAMANPQPAPKPLEVDATLDRPRPVEVAVAALPELPAPAAQPPPAAEPPVSDPLPEPKRELEEMQETLPPQMASESSQGTKSLKHAVSLPKNKLPQYPQIALQNGWEGAVKLGVMIAADGRVKDVTVLSSSQRRPFDREAANALRRWVFQPATRDGQPVETQITYDVIFRLDGQVVRIQ